MRISDFSSDVCSSDLKGQMLSYHNVVLASGKIGEWTGDKTKISAGLKTLRAADADGLAVLVQYDETGHIIVAGQEPLMPMARKAHIDAAPIKVTREKSAYAATTGN